MNFKWAVPLAFVMASSCYAFTIEKREFCPDPDSGGNDATWAPSWATVRVSQDAESRYLIGSLRWDLSSYHSYFTNKRIQGFPLGFEIETHFYNYDDAAATGLGPAYMRGHICETETSTNGTTCYGPTSHWFLCNLPNCYIDTQAFSAKNSVQEYAQPMMAVGSFDASTIRTGDLYIYKLRGATGRGNRSLMKLNFQPTRPYALGAPYTAFNQYACKFATFGPSKDYVGDSVLVPMTTGAVAPAVFAPVCMRVTYWHAGVDRQYQFCPL